MTADPTTLLFSWASVPLSPLLDCLWSALQHTSGQPRGLAAAVCLACFTSKFHRLSQNLHPYGCSPLPHTVHTLTVCRRLTVSNRVRPNVSRRLDARRRNPGASRLFLRLRFTWRRCYPFTHGWVRALLSLSPVSWTSCPVRVTHPTSCSDHSMSAQSCSSAPQALLDQRSLFWVTWRNLYATALPPGQEPVVLQAYSCRGL